jgi:flagellar biosynthetic protein FliO
MIDTVFQMLAALGVVIFLIYALSFAAKKRRGGNSVLSIIEYLSMGPKRGIAVVRVGKKALVLGVTPTDFRLLKMLGEEETKEIGFKKALDTEMSRPQGATPANLMSDAANRLRAALSRLTGGKGRSSDKEV